MLVGKFQCWHDALYAGDLLLTQKQVSILELTLLACKQRTYAVVIPALKEWFTNKLTFCHHLPTLMLFQTQKKIFWRILKNQTVVGLHIKGNKYYRSQWGPSDVWLPAFFKVFSFMFNIRNSYGFVNDKMLILGLTIQFLLVQTHELILQNTHL